MKIMDWLNGILSKENCLVEIAKFDFKKFMYGYYDEYLKENTVAGKNRQTILEKCPYRGELTNKDGGIEQFLAYRTADEILEKKVRLFDCDSSNDTCDVTTELYKIFWNYSKNSKESLWKSSDSEKSKNLWKWTNKDNKEENLDAYTSFGGDTMNSFLTTYNFCKDSINEDSELKSGLEKLAVLTHTIGNFVLVPYGFNKARYGSTRDYWDASLDILRKEGFTARSGKHFKNDNFEKYINVFFLWDYIGENGEILPLFNKEKRKFVDEQKYGMLTSLDDAKDFLRTVNKAIYRRGIFMAGQLCIALGISLDEDFRGNISEKYTNVTEIYKKMSSWLTENNFSSYEKYFGEIFKWLDEEKNKEETGKKQEIERVKSILKVVYVEMFIQDVEVLRSDNEKCEVEVCKRAMQLYKKYPYYEEWNIQEIENKHGAYILKRDKQALTADIVTSIKSILNKFSEDTCGLLGSEICKSILNQDNFLIDSGFPEQIRQYMKAFAIVYYWCGNMMPVPSQDAFGSNGADNWIYKMMLLRSFFKCEPICKTHDNWKKWVEEKRKKDGDWIDSWKEFVEGNYLIDCYAEKSDQIKNIVSCDKIINSLSNCNIEILCKNNYELAKELLVNHVKMIIQRSYRIQYQFSGHWNCPKEKGHMEKIKSIMQYVFEQAGFEPDEAKNLAATVF